MTSYCTFPSSSWLKGSIWLQFFEFFYIKKIIWLQFSELLYIKKDSLVKFVEMSNNDACVVCAYSAIYHNKIPNLI